jgi:hypothetical protein
LWRAEDPAPAVEVNYDWAWDSGWRGTRWSVEDERYGA